jgi:ribosomal protein S18 acetylase RimI-like enzyme
VLPAYEWCGIEAEGFSWAETRLEVLRQQDPAHWSGDFVSGARQDDPRRIRFLEEHGFEYSGRFAEVNMLRSLSEPLPDLTIPHGYRVCSMEEAVDICDRSAAHREVWQPWTVGNVSADDYAHFMQLPGYQRDLDVVTLTPEGIIAAYVNGWIDPINRIGDFGPVGARLAYRRQGLTRLALLESLRRMQGYGMERVCISTGVTNIPALRLYDSVGFRAMNKYLDYVKTNG